LLFIGVAFSNEKTSEGCKIDEARLVKIRNNAIEICNQVLMDYEVKSSYPPSILALSCIQVSRQMNLLPSLPHSLLALLSLDDIDTLNACTEVLL